MSTEPESLDFNAKLLGVRKTILQEVHNVKGQILFLFPAVHSFFQLFLLMFFCQPQAYMLFSYKSSLFHPSFM